MGEVQAWPTAEIGLLATATALGLTVVAAVASAYGARAGIDELVVSGRRAMLAAAALTTVAVGVLVLAFVVHDFTLAYVWQTSNTTTPTFYLLTGLWGGQAGSLLFWSWLMAVFASAALLRPWRADAALMPWFTAVCAAVTGFFLFLVVFVSNPFERLTVAPSEGNGLNPLLQHPGMAFHPPALYLGFTGLTIPYAFAMAALAARQTDAGWILASRRWMLVAWAFLSIGLSLGGRWAYDVLGWGGYWGWDPVENAAFMPWLAATAFLHSVMVQERRGTFKVWNMALVILTFSLVIVGTFLTRAGLVSSVHAFAQSDIGGYFLAFTSAVVLGSLALLWWRLPDLASEERIEHAVSREGVFMANNLLLMGALFAVFWGTLFPLFSEIVTDQRVTVGAPYFNRVVLPIFAAMLVLMAVGPLVGWRKGDAGRLARVLAFPLVGTLAITVVLYALGVRRWVAVVGFGICVFALWVTLLEIGRGVAARMRRGEGPARATLGVFRRQRRRYGGYLVHAGVIVLAVGVIGSNVYQLEVDRTLDVGESMTIGAYTLTHRGLAQSQTPDKQMVHANLDAVHTARGGGAARVVAPRKDVFRLREDQPMTIPAVWHRPTEDLYVLLGTYDPASERVTLKVYVNPLINCVWLGMVILVLGTLIAAWPDAAEERVMNAELQRLVGGAALGVAR
ncbi:cytochrome C biogenesis protein [bacterium]|nr:heme lyase CcmF/NrfE family subunit [Chloroflexi bacterium CFX6]RIL07577.1 MAG: cytochrome C biogenesis protein [bacterium]